MTVADSSSHTSRVHKMPPNFSDELQERDGLINADEMGEGNK